MDSMNTEVIYIYIISEFYILFFYNSILSYFIGWLYDVKCDVMVHHGIALEDFKHWVEASR